MNFASFHYLHSTAQLSLIHNPLQKAPYLDAYYLFRQRYYWNESFFRRRTAKSELHFTQSEKKKGKSLHTVKI